MLLLQILQLQQMKRIPFQQRQRRIRQKILALHKQIKKRRNLRRMKVRKVLALARFIILWK